MKLADAAMLGVTQMRMLGTIDWNEPVGWSAGFFSSVRAPDQPRFGRSEMK
jgi:hypothetical protein